MGLVKAEQSDCRTARGGPAVVPVMALYVVKCLAKTQRAPFIPGTIVGLACISVVQERGGTGKCQKAGDGEEQTLHIYCFLVLEDVI